MFLGQDCAGEAVHSGGIVWWIRPLRRRSSAHGTANAFRHEPTPISRNSEKRRQDAGATKLKPAKSNSFDAAEVWKQTEDVVIPRLRLTPFERAVYWHLMRHSQLEGTRRLRFSIGSVARGAYLTEWAVRKAVRGLVHKAALRLSERSKRGHEVEVRLPEEIRGLRANKLVAEDTASQAAAVNLEEMDFWERRELREAIHARENGRCFYCLLRVKPAARCLDHVVPQVEMGGNSYRNLVSSCMGCNAQKREWKAEDFLRWLYREGRLSEEELKGRLRALEDLAAGKMQPKIERSGGSKGAPRPK